MRYSPPALAGLFLTILGAAAAGAQESEYSTFDYESCPPVESPEPGVIEVRRCQGPAGLPVYWHAEPDASHIVIGTQAGPFVFEGGAFSAFEVNNVVEWRWLTRDTPWPQAAIVRYRHGRSVSDLSQSRLAIYMIEPDGQSCVLEMIAGANANERARETVDRQARSFRCPR